eukprot:10261157-Alexandrium_andersonii.AAC.1
MFRACVGDLVGSGTIRRIGAGLDKERVLRITEPEATNCTGCMAIGYTWAGAERGRSKERDGRGGRGHGHRGNGM